MNRLPFAMQGMQGVAGDFLTRPTRARACATSRRAETTPATPCISCTPTLGGRPSSPHARAAARSGSSTRPARRIHMADARTRGRLPGPFSARLARRRPVTHASPSALLAARSGQVRGVLPSSRSRRAAELAGGVGPVKPTCAVGVYMGTTLHHQGCARSRDFELSATSSRRFCANSARVVSPKRPASALNIARSGRSGAHHGR